MKEPQGSIRNQTQASSYHQRSIHYARSKNVPWGEKTFFGVGLHARDPN